jgi:hypothetical protein
MLKFVKLVLKFIVFSSLFYIVLVILWGGYSSKRFNLNYLLGAAVGANDFIFTRLKEVKTVRDVDILFLGSSHTLRGFDTRIFNQAGYKTFNMGSNTQTPIHTEFLLSRYLDSLNPKIVIFEICPYILSFDGVESALEFISNDNIGLDNIKLAFKHNNLKVFNTLIYAYYREIIQNDKSNYIEESKSDEDTYIDGGFVERKDMFYTHQSFDKKKWKFNKKEFKSLENIIDVLNERNVNIIFVQSPVTSDLYNSYLNNNDFDNEMNKYGKYYNFNNLLQLDDTLYFWDSNHLNQNGVKIFNDSLINILEDNEGISKFKKIEY